MPRYSTRGNLPVELSSFVGRAPELSEIRRLLPVARAVTLTGPGGIGKSRLALRAAHKLGRHFPDGVWMIELAELDEADLLPHALAHAMSVYDRPDVAIEDALQAHLKERRLLLVLDNCEHLLTACRELVSTLVSPDPLHQPAAARGGGRSDRGCVRARGSRRRRAVVDCRA
jgi:predicted ATPase